MPTDFLRVLWRFLRGETSVADLERWLYAEPTLEAWLGAELHAELLAADFRDPTAVEGLARRLRAFAEEKSRGRCLCVRLGERAVLDMGAEESDVFFARFELASRRGQPRWWLGAGRCGACGQAWLVAEESRILDVFVLCRLDDEAAAGVERGEWPATLETYESVIRAGRAAGKSVRWMDGPSHAPLWTVVDLARARPGIPVAELADLLCVSVEAAADLARQARDEEGVEVGEP